MKVARAFYGRVVGYRSSNNRTAQIGNEQCEGHDFAIISDRFIVDYWAFRIAGLIANPVLDMSNKSDHALVRVLYGNEQTWDPIPIVREDSAFDKTA